MCQGLFEAAKAFNFIDSSQKPREGNEKFRIYSFSIKHILKGSDSYQIAMSTNQSASFPQRHHGARAATRGPGFLSSKPEVSVKSYTFRAAGSAGMHALNDP